MASNKKSQTAAAVAGGAAMPADLNDAQKTLITRLRLSRDQRDDLDECGRKIETEGE